ncbi:MAG: ribosome recycling factor [bacterium]|nr:ribosome recycling factor [bacterium]
MQDIEERMNKTVEMTQDYLSTLRTGRANPDILSKIQVDYYGTKVPLKQLVSISVPENMLLMLNIFDKADVQNVEKAIMASDLNLTPITDGSVIRLRMPELTEERRKERVKLLKKHVEEGRVSIRNIRRDAIDDLRSQGKKKDISEDDAKRKQEEVQKLTDKYIQLIDEKGKEKEAEIMMI